jgi:hypothetical protein
MQIKNLSYIKSTLTILLFIFSVTSHNTSLGSDKTEYTNSPSLISGGFDWSNRENRLKALKNVEFRLNDLNSQIPNAKPDELKYIQKEQDEISKIDDRKIREARFIKLYDYAPYHNQKVKSFLNRGLKLIELIKESKNIKSEMAIWSQLTGILLEQNTIYDGLLTFKQNKQPILDVDPWFESYIIATYGQGIVNWILTPYLIKESET